MSFLTTEECIGEGASLKGFARFYRHIRQLTECREDIHRLRDEVSALPAWHIATRDEEHLVVNFRIRRPVARVTRVDVRFAGAFMLTDGHTVVGHDDDEGIVP